MPRTQWVAWVLPVIVLSVAMWLNWAPAQVGSVVAPQELVALRPAGTANTLDFGWASPFTAVKYRLVIRDASGTEVFSGETTDASLTIDATARTRFATMVDYSWTVIALDSMGEVIAESAPRSFTYQP